MAISNDNILLAVEALRAGAVIAYPTEAVFGIGCDPFNETAVAKIRQLKSRSSTKGLLIIACDWSQIQDFVDTTNVADAMDGWPGPITKVFPTTQNAPKAVCAQNNTIAVRITNHPTAKNICAAFGGAIVSTSANTEGQLPAKTKDEVAQYFDTDIAVIIDKPLGNLDSPTKIIDAVTGELYRD